LGQAKASELPDAFPALFHSPRPPLSGKKRRKEGEKRFFGENAASGNTLVLPDAAFSLSFLFPGLKCGVVTAIFIE